MPPIIAITKRNMFIRSDSQSAWGALLAVEAPVHGTFKVTEGKALRFETPYAWATLAWEYRLIALAEGTIVTLEAKLSGKAAGWLAALSRKRIARDADAALARLRDHSERAGGADGDADAAIAKIRA
jgi:hypothetical protein